MSGIKLLTVKQIQASLIYNNNWSFWFFTRKMFLQTFLKNSVFVQNYVDWGMSVFSQQSSKKEASTIQKGTASILLIINIEGFHAKRVYIAFWANFYFLQDGADFWQTDLF